MAYLPGSYDGFVDELKKHKDNPEELQSFVSIALGEFVKHYDSTRGQGHIAEDNPSSYSKLIRTYYGQEIPNAICGPVHQLITNALNDAGIESRTIALNSLRKDKGGGAGHIALIYSPQKGDYVVNDWDAGTSFHAKDMLEAATKAEAYSPTLESNGVSNIFSKSGEHMDYSELTVGKLLNENPDKNSAKSLEKPFGVIKQNQDTKFNISTGATAGTDAIQGDYKSLSLSANYKKNGNLGDFDYKVNVDGSYDFLNTTKTITAPIATDEPRQTGIPNPALPKQEPLPLTDAVKDVKHNILSGNATGMLLSPSLNITPDISAKGFVSESVEGLGDFSLGTLTRPGEVDSSVGSVGDCTSTTVSGATSSIKTEKTKTDVSVFGGARVVRDADVYEQPFVKLRAEKIAGGQISTSLKHDLDNNAQLTLNGEVSGVEVNAPGYKKDLVGAKGEAVLQKGQKKASIYAGVDNQTTSFTGLLDKHKENNTYIGGSYQQKIKKNTLGVDVKVSETGTNFKDLGKNIKTGVTVGFNF